MASLQGYYSRRTAALVVAPSREDCCTPWVLLHQHETAANAQQVIIHPW
eukprot:CAMPEP_0172454186 /NCGR_PEP_ID=MMETSP1065-20121228/11254_1 /TAXON_ID=265537 /ORGANISM="Amphiprora paludosa, Strain CCMP125" /LENGTH=48 /DNA_ID= /DNA_START= /DNA_END= /DNA_ORIENTATION=